jgi:hypothetical protein
VGGIFISGTAALINSSIWSNNAFANGGIVVSGTLFMTNCTVSGNLSGDSDGGGLLAFTGSAWLRSCTICSNAAPHAGGIAISSNATVNIKNTIVAGNSAGGEGPDVFGVLTSEGFNLIQNPAGAVITGVTGVNILGLSAGLGPLQDNGGPTLTHALLPGSPAIDAGSPNDFPPTDQRGVLRPDGGLGSGPCDIGAFETACECQCLSPFEVVQTVLADLQHVLAGAQGAEGQRLAAIIQQLRLAAKTSLWKDTSHLQAKQGGNFFNAVAIAVKLLEKPRKTELSANFVEQLACAERVLLETAVRDASTAGGDPNRIAEANNQLAQGNQDAQNENFQSALKHYEEGWHQVAELR